MGEQFKFGLDEDIQDLLNYAREHPDACIEHLESGHNVVARIAQVVINADTGEFISVNPFVQEYGSGKRYMSRLMRYDQDGKMHAITPTFDSAKISERLSHIRTHDP